MLRTTYLVAMLLATTFASAQTPPGWDLRRNHVWSAHVQDPADSGGVLLQYETIDSASAHALGSEAHADAWDVQMLSLNGYTSSASASGGGSWYLDSSNGEPQQATAQLSGAAYASIYLMDGPCAAKSRTYTAASIAGIAPEPANEDPGVCVFARIGATTEDEWTENGEHVTLPGFEIEIGDFRFSLPRNLRATAGAHEAAMQAQPPEAKIRDTQTFAGETDYIHLMTETSSEAMAWADGWLWRVAGWMWDNAHSKADCESHVVVLVDGEVWIPPTDGGLPTED